MTLNNMSEQPVGVIGAGSFGTAVASILAQKNKVMLYARNAHVVEAMRQTRMHHGVALHENIMPSHELDAIAGQCQIIFPVIPSASFRQLMRQIAPYLRPSHILIHGTKGMDLKLPKGQQLEALQQLSREEVLTMSEVIAEESDVIRIGCLAGPNLAKELADGQPAATVVASNFSEVIEVGIKLLRNERFQVYGNNDLIGVELCGILKNIIAIASGALSGLGMGENARALLISRGMVEMIYLGRAMGCNIDAFIGLAGVGDLVATCSSPFSRNFTVGFRLAKGETLNEILDDMEEVAEGVNTIKIMTLLANHYKVRAPITETLHRVLFGGLKLTEALHFLMKYPFNTDIDFL